MAKSTKRYKAIDPDLKFDGDFVELVSEPCMVTVTATPGKGKHEGKVFNNVASVATMRAKEARKAADLINPPKTFLLDEPDLEILGSLPDWLQDKIKANLEFKGSALEAALSGDTPKEEKKPKAKKAAPDVGDGDDVPW